MRKQQRVLACGNFTCLFKLRAKVCGLIQQVFVLENNWTLLVLPACLCHAILHLRRGVQWGGLPAVGLLRCRCCLRQFYGLSMQQPALALTLNRVAYESKAQKKVGCAAQQNDFRPARRNSLSLCNVQCCKLLLFGLALSLQTLKAPRQQGREMPLSFRHLRAMTSIHIPSNLADAGT
jgi:hypothetical protein